MKFLLLIVLLFSLTSCASKPRKFIITNHVNDGLRHESLYRYDSSRLLSSKNTGNIISVALRLCHQNNFKKAHEIFLNTFEQRKDHPEYWSDVGTCYYLQAEYTKAKFYYQLALGQPSSPAFQSKILNNLGLIYLKLSKFDEAKEHFQQSQQLNPNALTPKFNLAQIFLYFGHYKNAEKLLTHLYQRESKDIDFIYLLGHTKLMQYQYKEAKKYFNFIPENYLSRQDIANSIAMLHLKLGDYKKAKEALERSEKTGSLKSLNAYVEMNKVLENYIN